MKLSNQAVGALMMALQKSLMEQSDILPVLAGMDFELGDDGDLEVLNPPVVSFEGVQFPDEDSTETTSEE